MTLEELKALIMEVSGIPISSMVEAQIKKLTLEGYTYKEIGRCVYYFFIIRHNDVSNIGKYGIGIVKNIRTEANQYYDAIAQQQEKQRNAAKQVVNHNVEVQIVTPTRRIFKKKGVDINGLH